MATKKTTPKPKAPAAIENGFRIIKLDYANSVNDGKVVTKEGRQYIGVDWTDDHVFATQELAVAYLESEEFDAAHDARYEVVQVVGRFTTSTAKVTLTPSK